MIDYGSRRNKLFTAKRNLESTDENDFVFSPDTELVIAYHYSTETSIYDQKPFEKSNALLFTTDGQTCKGWDELL